MVNKLLVLLGPTAVGKTDLSLRLAKELQGEIISADSRLFYKGMDIGTAKPTFLERSKFAHHLLDICEPDETITVAQFQRLAYAAIDQIQARGSLPILVGGSGQYIMAVVEGWGIPEVGPYPALRAELAALGEQVLANWLKILDAKAAANIDSRNIRRVIRAIEVTLVTGIPISELQRKSAPAYEICMIGLNRSREKLYSRIDRRVDTMVADGLLLEVISLREAGYSPSLPAMSGLGYRQIMAHLDGQVSLDEALERTKFETHRFARHQKTWFKQEDTRIRWFDLDENGKEEAVIQLAKRWLQGAEG